MPFHTCLLPFVEPLHLRAWLDKELHLHLLKLAHTENELAGNNLVAESLANLCNAKRNFHASCLLHVEIIDKYTLGCFRTEVYLARTVGGRAHLCGEHQVELAHVCPVLGTADGIDNTLVENDLLQLLKVHSIHG